MANKLSTVVATEPVMALAVLLAAALTAVGIATDAGSVVQVLVVVLPVVTGLLQRLHVVPKTSVGIR